MPSPSAVRLSGLSVAGVHRKAASAPVWETREGRKIPYFLHRQDQLLAFAGLYELWPDPVKAEDDRERWLWSYIVLTRPAPDALGLIHDRSPIVVLAALDGPELVAAAFS